MQFIAKIVAYRSNYGMMMGVTKAPDQILPDDFSFVFPFDTDESKGMEMTFYKRGQPIKTIGSDILERLKDGEVGITLSTVTVFPTTNQTENILKLCLQSDAIHFKYVSTDEESKSLRFPLTGFAEHYLEQFV